VKIHLDYDETLVHSFIAYGEDDVERLLTTWGNTGRAFKLTDGWYVTFPNPHAKDIIDLCREKVGDENLFILSTGTQEYLQASIKAIGLGFDPKRVYGREDIDYFNNEHCSGSRNILVDNENYDYHKYYNRHSTKVTFLDLKEEDYIEVDDFFVYNDPLWDEGYEDFVKKLEKIFQKPN